MASSENEAMIRQWVREAWNSGNFGSVARICASDYVLHDPAGLVVGGEGLAEFIAAYRKAFPDLHLTIEDVIAAGDKVSWRFAARGTHLGEFKEIPPSGNPITVTGIVFSHFRNGKWAEDWVNYDALGMLMQVGARLTPA